MYKKDYTPNNGYNDFYELYKEDINREIESINNLFTNKEIYDVENKIKKCYKNAYFRK